MSRGDRVAVSGNLSTSMRDNYGEHGVAEYYTKVGSTYRNPHYPGIRLCLFSWLNRWWQEEQANIGITIPQILLFDMACGDGEVTLAFAEWCNTGKKLYQESLTAHDTGDAIQSAQRQPTLLQRKGVVNPIPLGPTFPRPQILASDPFTAEAYKTRTSYPCSNLSFEAIAEGLLPPTSVNIVDGLSKNVQWPGHLEYDDTPECHPLIEMVVCSFALHLIENPSSLFALLWQLSTRARWLVVLAPHKKPEIKDGWGWLKWHAENWSASQITNTTGEFLHDRVHCRIFRSANA